MTESRRLPTAVLKAKAVGSLPRLEGIARQAVAGVLDLIFPPRCPGCGKAGALVCASCERKIDSNFWVIPEASRPITPLAGLHTSRSYTEPLIQVIHAFKYENQPRLAGFLGKYLYSAYQAHAWPADLVTAVPLHADRLRERGYNQAELLAEALAECLGLPCVPGALTKTRHTEQQARLSAQERLQNVAGAFTADSVQILNKSIIIVDDVVTTGATLRQCATALIAAGAARVWALTVASPSL